MKDIFNLIAAVESILLIIWLLTVFLKKNVRSSKSLIALSAGVLVVLLSYLLLIHTSKMRLALILSSIYFISMDWLLIFMMQTILSLPYAKKNSAVMFRLIRLLCIIAAVDTLSLALNFVFNHSVDLVPVYDAKGRIYTWYSFFKIPYYLHLAYCYILCCIFIAMGILKISKFPSAYQKKYYILLIVFIFTALINALYVLSKWSLDYSILVYIAVLFAFFYFIFRSLPQEFSGMMLEQVVLNLSSAIICYDLDGKCLFANNTAYNLFPSNVPGNKNLFIETYIKKWKKFHPDANGIIHIEDDCFIIKGEIHTFIGELRTLVDKKKRPIAYLIKLDDRTDYLTSLEQEKFLASHDPLTGLLNRTAFFDRAEDILRTAPDVRFCFVCTDIENFKLFNDVFGEEAGNEILIGQARTFEKINYPDCIHGRISGDKFAMLIEKSNFVPKELEEKFEEFQDTLSQRYHYGVKIGIGVYEIEDTLEDVQLMCDKAYMAIQKNSGSLTKNLFFYDTRLMKERMEEQSILSDFPKALEENQLLFYIQPQFDSRTNSVNGGEALVRWNHPESGMINPNIFVSVLEETDYISSLDYYIWESVAKKLKDWKDRGYENFYLSVNISAKDFYYIDVYDVLTKLVEKYQINPKNMNLEVTETILMSNVEMHQNVLNKLRDYGFTIEMDDFGSGYSSLSTLRNLSMDVLKIDMEFLRSTENYEQSLKIINAIIEMAKSLDMTVITEGVEVENQAEALRNMGCDIFQGYYFSRPITVEAFEKRYILKSPEANQEGWVTE